MRMIQSLESYDSESCPDVTAIEVENHYGLQSFMTSLYEYKYGEAWVNPMCGHLTIHEQDLWYMLRDISRRFDDYNVFTPVDDETCTMYEAQVHQCLRCIEKGARVRYVYELRAI